MTVRLEAPVAKSSVPVAGAEKVLITQVGEALGIGSGVPKKQPVFVQSKSAVAVAIWPTLHTPPAQPLTAKRFVDPGGVVLSGTCEMPPPSERLPQSRFFKGTVPARSRNV